jgi:hypothetical protein
LTRLHTSFVLGFHGCDREIGEKALAGELNLIQSDRDYDWLGPGVYFWEGDPARALEWAQKKASKKPAVVPYVIGAVIDRGNCLDLTFRENIELLREAYTGLVASFAEQGKQLPQNKDVPGDKSFDKLLRNLDCAVIRYFHDSIDQQLKDPTNADGSLEPFDTVRGLFQEGDPVYPGSGFFERTHTQIAVRSLTCIKGIFRVRS